jgi:hypothetical protein
MTISSAILRADGSRQLMNLLVSDGLISSVDAPREGAFVPSKRHLADVLPVISVGAGVASVPRLVADGLDAAVQSSEGNVAPSNVLAELELIRQPFSSVLSSITTSRQILDDSKLVEALIGGELREALRSSADTELARQLAEYAPLLTATGSTDFPQVLVEGVFAFQKRWGWPSAIVVDHSVLLANAAKLISAGTVVQFAPDALTIGGVPVVGANLAEPGEAIVTSGTVLQREAEAVVSSRLHASNFVTNGVTLLASCRVAAVGPSLRVAV